MPTSSVKLAALAFNFYTHLIVGIRGAEENGVCGRKDQVAV